MEKPEISAESIFGEALDLPADQRTAFLASACKDDPALRKVVESLLADNDHLNGYLSTPAYAAAATIPPESYLATGSRLGRYTILEPIGTGGMGVVYRANDQRLEREVAIKMLAPGVLTSAEARRHFRQEGLALARLNHPGIAAVYDVGEENGQDYIVMELVPGEPLSARLRSGPLGLTAATKIVLETLDALGEAHAQGVIHRDLKPGNIMITPKDRAKVLDFGLAKMLAAEDEAAATQTQGIAGTPLYMSPEQALGERLDGRTDLWSLGVIYYETLTGQTPFRAEGSLAVLRAVTQDPLTHARQLKPELPPLADEIITRALEKDCARRYQTAAEMERDIRKLLGEVSPETAQARRSVKWIAAGAVLVLAAAGVAGWLAYRYVSERKWAQSEAPAQIENLVETHRPLQALALLERAEKDLPKNESGNGRLRELAGSYMQTVSVTSDPTGAEVAIQDYLTPDGAWKTLGRTPIAGVRIPKGYFRWKLAQPGLPDVVVAPITGSKMEFPLAEMRKAPQGMVYSPGGSYGEYVDILGWTGPYPLPPYYIDRYEVTNREYQQFVDSGGYSNPQYWPAALQKDGKTISRGEAMVEFRDTSGRPGPSTWTAGHYPEGQENYPVSGVSWYEAAAYAAWAGKSLPILSQWEQSAPADVAEYAAPISNYGHSAAAPVGKFQGLGPYGTYDMGGNVSEWVVNDVDDGRRFLAGGRWDSPEYSISEPLEKSPFYRIAGAGLRLVRNLGPIPTGAAGPIVIKARDFSGFKPSSDAVFNAWKVLYDYPASLPLNAREEGVVQETADWREEKVSFDTAYNGERMSAYLFLPKRVKPPYQTVLFFPSARVQFLPPDSRNLGDVEFFDYVVQSGRAVVYPVYQDTYERRTKFWLPNGSQSITVTTDWYKDAGRTLDYLAMRRDIDSNQLAYLGVSMGAADGVIVSTLLQDRFKAIVWLDGGFFLWRPAAGTDQAEFAARMKKPVLMVNGRYDNAFSVERAQDPLFRLLATPAVDKSHVVMDTPHDVRDQRPMLARTVLDWLDKYLGRVAQ